MHYNIFTRKPGMALFHEKQNGDEVEVDTATETGMDAIQKFIGDTLPAEGTQYLAIPFTGKYGQRLVTTATIRHEVIAVPVEDKAPKGE